MITNVFFIERAAAFRHAEDLRRAEQQRRVRLARQYARHDQHEHVDASAHPSRLHRLLARVRHPRAVTTTS